MKPKSKKAMIGAGVAATIAGLSGFLFTPHTPWLNGGCMAVGLGLVAEALILGRKPRA